MLLVSCNRQKETVFVRHGDKFPSAGNPTHQHISRNLFTLELNCLQFYFSRGSLSAKAQTVRPKTMSWSYKQQKTAQNARWKPQQQHLWNAVISDLYFSIGLSILEAEAKLCCSQKNSVERIANPGGRQPRAQPLDHDCGSLCHEMPDRI